MEIRRIACQVGRRLGRALFAPVFVLAALGAIPATAQPSLTITVVRSTTTEGDDGSPRKPWMPLVFRVSLSEASTRAVTVDYQDAGTGTATPGTDYRWAGLTETGPGTRPLVAGTLTIPAGRESAPLFWVLPTGDTLHEPDETVAVSLSNPTNATISVGTATGTIIDDDGPLVDYDSDDDGLIEIVNLVQLNAVRWDLDGDGDPGYSCTPGTFPTRLPTPACDALNRYNGAFPNRDPSPGGRMGCPSGTCTGYELGANSSSGVALDFDGYDTSTLNWDPVFGWEPIGGYVGHVPFSKDPPCDLAAEGYSATFRGNGHVISNLYIGGVWEENLGLFKAVGCSGVIDGVGLLDVNFNVATYNTSRVYGSGLVGLNFGTITDSYATGTLSVERASVFHGRAYGGMLVARNYGTVTGSHAGGVAAARDATVGGLIGLNFGTSSHNYAAVDVVGERGGAGGGLIALNQGTVIDSHATGAVTGGGGLVGANQGRIANSYATGPVTGYAYRVGQGTDVTAAGGLVGWIVDGAVADSYATGDVNGINAAGGLAAGLSNGTVANSHATGDVHCAASTNVSGFCGVGGLVGRSEHGTITGSHATGAVSGGYDSAGLHAGGLVGVVTTRFFSEPHFSVTASYATGTVSGGRAGGLVGALADGGHITASYATGAVSGSTAAGGLVGEYAAYSGAITASYATGAVSRSLGLSSAAVGGLVGGKDRALDEARVNITASFWDIETTGQSASFGSPAGAGKTSAQLRAPTSASGVFAGWDGLTIDGSGSRGDVWDFGTANQYPVLSFGNLTAHAQRASIAATVPSPLSWSTLDGATVDVALPAGYTYAGADTLAIGHFSLAGTAAGVTLSGAAIRMSDTVARLMLALPAGTGTNADGTLSVTVAAAGHSGSAPLTTSPIPVTVHCVDRPFTDEPLGAGIPIRAVHFDELRARIDLLRTARRLPTYEWTDRTLIPGVTPVRSRHMTELREAVEQVSAAAAGTPVAWTDPAIRPAAPIEALHVTELRHAVQRLECR